MTGVSSEERGARSRSASDLDLRHAASEKVRADRARIELLEPFLALMPDAAVVVDEAGVIVSANERAAVLFGYPAGELIGRPVEHLIPERFRHRHRAHRAEYADAPRARPMGASLDLSGRRKDGTEFPIDISLAPVAAAGGSLVVAAVRDATDRRAATAAQAQLAAIVQSSGDAILSVTVEGVIASWNPGAERLLGHRSGDVIGRHLSVVVPEQASLVWEELLAMAEAGDPSPSRDTKWRRRDGGEVDVALSVSALQDPVGRVFGFSAILRNVTERKQAEGELRQVLDDERRRERQQTATSEIRLALLSGAPVNEALDLICTWACELLDGHASAAFLASPHGLEVVAAAGTAVGLVGGTVDLDSVVGEAIAGGITIPVRGFGLDPAGMTGHPGGGSGGASGGGSGGASGGGSGGPGGGLGRPGPGLVTPLASDRARGALLVARSTGAAEFTIEDVAVLESLAGQATLSMELGRARDDEERLLLAEDRERIARDLHDLVIQRLFASGMRLQALVRLTDDPKVIDRVERTMEELDTTIRDIRTTIFALENPAQAAGGVRAELLRLATEASENLGFEPSVRFDGPVDALVPRDVVPHVLAVVREALSNVARHARASEVQLELRAGHDLLLVVVDNGVGLGSPSRHSGLANLRQRAEDLGGNLLLLRPDGGGTRLEWSVPLGS